MKKPNVLVLSGYGLNCEEETALAFTQAGGVSTIVHINDLIRSPKELKKYQIVAVPGGFAYGDDTGAGNAYANKLRNHLWNEVKDFISHDKLLIGICNGCQIITSLGLIPGFNMEYGIRRAAWTNNDSGRYIDRWVDIKIEGPGPWLKKIDSLTLPIAHGEGKLFVDKKTLNEIKIKKLIAAKYIKGEISEWFDLPANPTGTIDDIAGLTDETGKILALMPHPERALSFTQLPHWTYLKEQYTRKRKKVPVEGPGLTIFKNAIRYFT